MKLLYIMFVVVTVVLNTSMLFAETKEKLIIQCDDKDDISACVKLGKEYGEEKDFTNALKYIKKACNGDEMYSCGILGYMYQEGFGVQQNYKNAIKFYTKSCNGGEENLWCINLENLYKEKACDKGDMRSCAELGYTYLYTEQKYNPKKAIKLFKKACKAKEMMGCFGIGLIYDNGHGVKRDYIKAVKFYSRVCDGDEMRGCHRLGIMYMSGKGVKRDVKKAIKLIDKSCDGGFMKACNWLGSRYSERIGDKQDYNKALKYYTKACDGGFFYACISLGLMYERGQGVKQDNVKATELYSIACDEGTYCMEIDRVYENGCKIGDKNSCTNLKNEYQKRCEQGDRSSCTNLGLMYEDGFGVKQNDIKAVEFYNKTCTGGNYNDCYRLTGMYIKGCDKSNKESCLNLKSTYHKYCYNDDIMHSCTNLGYMYQDGKGVDRDYDKALNLFQKSCEGEENLGCENFEKLYKEVCSTDPKKFCSKYK